MPFIVAESVHTLPWQLTHNEHVGDGDVERDVCVHDVQQGLVHEVHAEAQAAKGEESIPGQESVNETWETSFSLYLCKGCVTVNHYYLHNR